MCILKSTNVFTPQYRVKPFVFFNETFFKVAVITKLLSKMSSNPF